MKLKTNIEMELAAEGLANKLVCLYSRQARKVLRLTMRRVKVMTTRPKKEQ